MRRVAPYLCLTLLALPAVWPLAAPGLPRTNDALPHLYRAVELDALVRAGVLFPRWAPDLVHGYGYPVFNFFPYLAHYLVIGLHALGLNFLTAYNAACGLALLASAWGAYRLGRDHFGEAAGLVAGVAYLYSPYLLYDTYIRGSLPENLALALLPWALFYLRRAVGGDRRATALAALTLGAALLAHHGVMLQAMPFVVVYGGMEMWRLGRPRLQSSILPYLLTFTFAFLLAAFFWLPALAEAGYAQIARGTGNGGMAYTENFLSLGELLALPRLPVDPRLLNPPVVRSLPLAAVALAGLAIMRVALWRFRADLTPRPPSLGGKGVPLGLVNERRQAGLPDGRGNAIDEATLQTRWVVFFALAALAATVLIHPVARPLWDTLPLLQLTLFPWRLLGPASLFFALLAGSLLSGWPTVTADGKREVALAFILPPSAFILLVLAGLPFAAPPREFVKPAPTLADVAAFEIPPDFIGTTTVGEYLPAWVRALPDTTTSRAQLMAGQPVTRHEAPGADVQVLASRSADETFAIDALAPLTFIYRTFYFPGWRATLDGKPVPITITDPHGLISVAVPAGTHTLRLHFGSTPVRAVGLVLSLMGLAGVAIWVLAGERRVAFEPASPTAPLSWPRRSTAFILQLSSLVIALLIILFRIAFDAGLTPLLRPGPRLAAPLNLDYSGELTLLGAQAARIALSADDELLVELFWQANHPLGVPYGFDVRLVDAAGHRWSQDDLLRPRDWRFTPGTDFWPTDQYILDPYRLQPLPGTPPGEYQVRVTAFAWPTLQSIGAHAVLPVTITAPSRARACPVDFPFEAAWDGVALTSVRFSTQAAAPGGKVVVSPCWQVVGNSAKAAPHAPLEAELRLLDPVGSAAAALPFIPGAPFPAGRWQPGDSLRDQVDVALPAALETGTYAWTLVVNGSPPLTIGTLSVTAPARTFEPPPVAETLNASLGPLSLYGLTVPRAGLARGTELPLTLVWHADALMPESYHVFLHLLAPDGALATQSDGVPAGWTRPTTGWLPGEYVNDDRTLFLRTDLPAGAYTLWAGLYHAETGARLITDAYPEGRIPLGEILVD